MILVRAISIPQLVSHDQSLIKTGITGSDIVWESGMGKDFGVLSSGATVKANNIEVLDIFHQGTIRMIEAADKLSHQDVNILSDLREHIASSVEKRRWL